MNSPEKPELLPSGKWCYRGIEFASEEAANSFKKSRDEEPSFVARVWETKACKWAVSGLIFLTGCFFISLMQPSQERLAEPAAHFNSADALAICQAAIKMASKDAEKAQVPYVPNQSAVGGYFFAWNNTTKLARLRNGLGLEVGVTALCKVDPISRRITSLTLDGLQLI